MASADTFLSTERVAGAASRRQVASLAEDMRANGWQGDPIDVARNGDDVYILTGHHQVAAAMQAGIEVPYVVRELPLAYNNSVREDIQSAINSWANR